LTRWRTGGVKVTLPVRLLQVMLPVATVTPLGAAPAGAGLRVGSVQSTSRTAVEDHTGRHARREFLTERDRPKLHSRRPRRTGWQHPRRKRDTEERRRAMCATSIRYAPTTSGLVSTSSCSPSLTWPCAASAEGHVLEATAVVDDGGVRCRQSTRLITEDHAIECQHKLKFLMNSKHRPVTDAAVVSLCERRNR